MLAILCTYIYVGHQLAELYIRRNQLSDVSELDHLSALPNLKVVWLTGNPLSNEPGYRPRVLKKLQQVKKLDNTGENLSSVVHVSSPNNSL